MKALIFGISGQDGAYLSQFLLGKGYEVYGASRNIKKNNFLRLKKLNVKNNIKLISADLNNFGSLLKQITKIKPNEIYNLSGQTSVRLSFERPVESLESITNASLNLLEIIRFM